jgi:hypothetical protein
LAKYGGDHLTISYSVSGFWRGVVIATVLAGTLNILTAFLFAALVDGTPIGVLSGIAGAAVPQFDFGGMAAAAVPPLDLADIDIGEIVNAAAGLIVHFAIVFAMVAVYFTFAARVGPINRHPWISGIGYGLILWGVMCWGVLPYRFPTMFPIIDPKEVAIQLFGHVVMVGIPIAYVARIAALWRGPDR